MKNEYKLILLSVLKKRTAYEEEQLNNLFCDVLDWELIGGQLFNHRLGGYFLGGLSNRLKKKIPNEMRKALELLCLAQKLQTQELINLTNSVLIEMEECGIRYAGLKGVVYNACLYNPGDRRSNDADILVAENDLDKLDIVLRRNGYIQTSMIDGEYKEASRKEKLIQRMNYHDLTPYVKLIENNIITMHDFDINIHFDSKDNDITEEVLDYGYRTHQEGFPR